MPHRTGSRSPAVPEALLDRLRREALPAPRSNAELLVTIFVKAGADTEPLRPFVEVDSSPAERSGFDRIVARARSKPDCAP